MTQVSFVTWQFVRLMVRLEQTRAQPARSALYDAWAEDWATLDRELERLREEDFDAFSALMMDHMLVLEDVTEDQAATATATLRELAGAIQADLAAADADMRTDLEFEAAGLAELADRIAAGGGGGTDDV